MGTFVVFDKVKEIAFLDGYNLSDTMRAAPLHGWTPDILTSSIASLTAYMTVANLSASGSSHVPSVDAGRRVNPASGGSLGDQWTRSAAGVMKFDLSDVAFTASSGLNLTARHVLLFRSGQAIPLGYAELSSGDLIGSQINVPWPADGIFELSDNV